MCHSESPCHGGLYRQGSRPGKVVRSVMRTSLCFGWTRDRKISALKASSGPTVVHSHHIDPPNISRRPFGKSMTSDIGPVNSQHSYHLALSSAPPFHHPENTLWTMQVGTHTAERKRYVVGSLHFLAFSHHACRKGKRMHDCIVFLEAGMHP